MIKKTASVITNVFRWEIDIVGIAIRRIRLIKRTAVLIFPAKRAPFKVFPFLKWR